VGRENKLGLTIGPHFSSVAEFAEAPAQGRGHQTERSPGTLLSSLARSLGAGPTTDSDRRPISVAYCAWVSALDQDDTVQSMPRRRASSAETISRPNGRIDTLMSLKFARPSGMQMIVRQSSTPVKRCIRASHQPPRMNHRTFPKDEPSHLPGWGTTARPKGQTPKNAIRSDATPNGWSR
jgi:hypothetical protein